MGREIWHGLVDAIPIDPAQAEVGGVFVHIVAPAESWLELHAAADAALLGHGLRVADIEDADALADQLRSGESIAPDLLVLALEAATAQEARLGEFHAYPPDDHPDPDAFEAAGFDEIAAELRDLAGRRELVSVRSYHDWHETVGFVAGVERRWTLIQRVDPFGQALGFRAVRLDAIAELEALDGEESYLPRLLTARPLTTTVPDIDLGGARALLHSVPADSSLISLVTEDMPPSASWIGQILALDEDGVRLRKVSVHGTWDGEVHFAFDAITYIGFGGPYEEALWLAVSG